MTYFRFCGLLQLVFLTLNLSGQQPCQVLLETIDEHYEGDCRRGLAHGEGKARGGDSYVGDFKKGLPHGEGVYTWANGDMYVGSFKKGVKEGQGVLTEADGSVHRGYWKDDKYVGEDKKPYELISQNPRVNRVHFRRGDEIPHHVDFRFTYLGRPVRARNLNVQNGFGVLINESDYIKTVEVYQFPFMGEITVEVESAPDDTKGMPRQWWTANITFKINQPGKWVITIEMRPA